jgi:glutamine amidotransferase
MIAVIDYGMGNLRSVHKALEKVGAEAEIVSDAGRLSLADKAVLPGVGAFKDTIEGIDSRGLRSAIGEFIGSGRPYLGICMGFQAIFDQSEEGGRHRGLGILKGRVRRFKADKEHKVPHIGWNRVRFRAGTKECPLFKGIGDNSYFYFDHSYYVTPGDEGITAGITDYGIDFTSAIWKDNVFAVQFHPEKSQENGLLMLRNFVEL